MKLIHNPNASLAEVLAENQKLLEALNKSRETIFEVRQQIQALRRTMREEACKTNTIEWIEVEKEMPDDGEAVLIAQQHGEARNQSAKTGRARDE